MCKDLPSTIGHVSDDGAIHRPGLIINICVLVMGGIALIAWNQRHSIDFAGPKLSSLNTTVYSNELSSFPSLRARRFSEQDTIVDYWTANLQKHNLTYRHQAKFHKKKKELILFSSDEEQADSQQDVVFPNSKIFPVDTGPWAAIRLNEDYSYIHIFKSGGTSIAIQFGESKAIGDEDIQATKYWMTFVRDPIDHFISGWAECGYRDIDGTKEERKKLKSEGKDSAEVLNTALRNYVQSTVSASTRSQPAPWVCNIHSYPQASYLVHDIMEPTSSSPSETSNRSPLVYEQMTLIADMQELSEVVNLIDGVAFDASVEPQRNASNNEFKTKFFPPYRKWITKNNLQLICDFVAADYFLFDFEPPEGCAFLTEKYNL